MLARAVARGCTCAVVELAHEHVLPALEEVEIAVGVYTGLSESDLPPGADPARHLAEKAQVFARGRGLRAAVLCADNPTSDLVAEVVAPPARVLRYGTREGARGPVDLLATAIEDRGPRMRVTLEGSPSLPAEIELPSGGRDRVLGALAALLVVHALGGSPEEAARRMC